MIVNRRSLRASAKDELKWHWREDCDLAIRLIDDVAVPALRGMECPIKGCGAVPRENWCARWKGWRNDKS